MHHSKKNSVDGCAAEYLGHLVTIKLLVADEFGRRQVWSEASLVGGEFGLELGPKCVNCGQLARIESASPTYNVCSSILNPYLKEIPCHNKYIILGIDFIIDNDHKPYIIEINGFPNLYSTGMVDVKYNMLNDFIKMYVLPKISGNKQRLGGWLKI